MASMELDIPPRDQTGGNRLDHVPSWSINIPSENPQHVEFTREATEPGLPPTYEEAVDTASTPPPSYDSLFGRVREAYKESSGICDFLSILFALLASAIGCSIILGLTIAVPISMAVMGWVYLGQCPINHFIPTYLLIGGCCGILKMVLHLFNYFTGSNDSEEEKGSFASTLCFFMMIWFVLGSYWVYRVYEPNYDSSKRYYCNHTLYTFAFWQVTSVYIILGTIGLFICGALKFS